MFRDDDLTLVYGGPLSCSSPAKPGWLVQCKPGLGDERCAAPARDQAVGIGNRIDAATRLRVGIAGEDKAVLFRQIGVVVAQIEVEGLVSEGHARLPVEIGRQREAAERGSLIAEPGIAGGSRERYAEVRRQQAARHVVAQPAATY